MTFSYANAFVLGCFAFLHFNLSAQTLQYSNAELKEVIKDIEQQSEAVFNYDPNLLQGYTYSGNIKLDQLSQSIERLFEDTPYEIQISGKYYLIILPDPNSYNFCGYLKDPNTNTPLPFANVFLNGTQKGTQTDDNGFFSLSFKAYKNQKITLSYLGYSAVEIIISQIQEENCETFFLKPAQNLYLGEVVVKDYLLPGITEGTIEGGITMDFNYLLNNYASQEHDVLKTVQLIPGVTSVDESASNLHIRGATPDHNLILWEGATLYDPGHLFGMISSVNPFVIDSVNVYKGVFNPKYDNRVGGIVDIGLKDEIAKGLSGGLATTLTEASAYLEFPILKNRLSFLLSGRNTVYGLAETPTLASYTRKVFQGTKVEEGKEEAREGFVEANENLRYYDLNAKLIFRPTDKLLFKLAVLNSQNNYQFSAIVEEAIFETEDRVNADVNVYSSHLQYEWNDQQQTKIHLVGSRYENTFEFGFTDEDNRYDEQVLNDIVDFQFGFSHQLTLPGGLFIEGGYNYDKKEVTFSFNESSSFEPAYTEVFRLFGNFHNYYGAFGLTKDKYQINAGLRNTFYVETGEWFLSPRLNMQLALTPDLKLKFSAGRFHQFISKLQTFGNQGLSSFRNIWVLSNDEANGSLSADKVSFGLVFRKSGWLIDAEIYSNQTKGLSTLTTSVLRGVELEESGQSEINGFDFLIKKRWNNYQLWLNYSLSENIYNFPDLIEQPFFATNDQRHRLSVVGNTTFGNWTIGSTLQLKSGLPFSVPEAVIRSEEEEEVFFFLDFPGINNQRLPAYKRLDVEIAYKWKFDSGAKAELSFSYINLFNWNNFLSRDYFIGDISEEDFEEGFSPDFFFIEKNLLRRTPLFMARLSW